MVNEYLRLNVDCWFVTARVDSKNYIFNDNMTFVLLIQTDKCIKQQCRLFTLSINKDINSIFIVYGQSRSGEKGHLDVLVSNVIKIFIR